MTVPLNYAALKAQEWQQRLLYSVAGLLLFETLSGLAVYLLPFSVPNRLLVVFHTLAGVVLVAPYIIYQIRHWRIYRRIRASHVKLTGYFAMIALIVSGLVLTWQAVFSTRISRGWDVTHVWATFALIASVMPHIGTLIVRATRTRAAAAGELLHVASRRFSSVTVLLAGVV